MSQATEKNALPKGQQFNGKIKKADFEDKLLALAGDREVSASRLTEDGKALTLYYIAHGHAGTWQRTGACIFSNKHIEENIASTKRLSALT